MHWRLFYNTLDDNSRTVVESLQKKNNAIWNQTFESFYFQHLISRALVSSTNYEEQLVHYKHLLNEVHSLRIDATRNHLISNRQVAIEILRKGNKDLFNTLFKKKQMPTVSWSSLIFSDGDFTRSIFPIHYTSSINNAKGYDVVIQLKSNPDLKVEAHQFYPLQKEHLAIDNQKMLYLNDYNYTQSLEELISTDKLRASKKLAKFILSLNQHVKIYQLKSGNIISLLPMKDDEYFTELFDNYGLKQLDMDQDVVYDRLTESILMTDRKQFLLIRDELINPKLYNYLEWQLDVLTKLKQAGYTIFSVNSASQYEDNNHVFSQLKSLLVNEEETVSSELKSSTPDSQFSASE